MVSKMHADYKKWFKDVSSTRGFEAIKIVLGSPRENPTILTRQDWRGPRADVTPKSLGHWEVEVAKSARFDITVHVTPRPFPSTAHIAFGTPKGEQAIAPGQAECVFTGVELPAGPGRLEAWVAGNKTTAGVLDMTVRCLPDRGIKSTEGSQKKTEQERARTDRGIGP